MSFSISADALLAAIDGLAYVVGYNGTILLVSPRWDELAAQHNGSMVAGADVLHRNVLSMIAGDSVRDAYRAMHNAVFDRSRAAVTFTFRCDAPDVRRLMRMSISPLRSDGDIVALLYQSQVLAETQRPPLRLFAARQAFHDGIGVPEKAEPRPLVTMCSFCQKLAWPLDAAPDARDWIEPELYYALGGVSDVALSHTICPDCADQLHKPAASK
jgi:hypothetical protein